MNSSVVQMFHCRLALFHAAQCCGQGSQLDGFPFWSIHPLSCLRIKRDLRNGGTKAWTHPTQSGIGLDAHCGQWPDKTRHRYAHPLSLTLQSELPESGNQGCLFICKWGSAGEEDLCSRAAGEAEPPSSPRSSGAGFAPDQLFSGPEEGMPLLRGRSVLSVLLEHMCTVWFHS